MKKEWNEDTWERSRWPNFSFAEMKCSHSGLCFMDESALDKLQEMRNQIGPLWVTSAYRDKAHPIEARKTDAAGNPRPGAHFTGKAFDISCSGEKALQVVAAALSVHFTGLGIKQHGAHAKRFIHIDMISEDDNFHVLRPTIWSYGS